MENHWVLLFGMLGILVDVHFGIICKLFAVFMDNLVAVRAVPPRTLYTYMYRHVDLQFKAALYPIQVYILIGGSFCVSARLNNGEFPGI